MISLVADSTERHGQFAELAILSLHARTSWFFMVLTFIVSTTDLVSSSQAARMLFILTVSVSFRRLWKFCDGTGFFLVSRRRLTSTTTIQYKFLHGNTQVETPGSALYVGNLSDQDEAINQDSNQDSANWHSVVIRRGKGQRTCDRGEVAQTTSLHCREQNSASSFWSTALR